MITVFNKRDHKQESFTPTQALDWLETIGLHAAYEMYSEADVTRLMNYAKAE